MECTTAIDDEMAVLGWFIMDPDCRRRLVTEIRSSETFEPSGLAPLWDLLLEMHAAGSDINPANVRREAKKAKLKVTDEQQAQISRKSSNLNQSVRAVRLAAMRRWLHRQGESLERAAADPEADPIELASKIHDDFGKAIRVASKIADRGGGFDELSARLDAMVSGRISNLVWPDAPLFTKLARALESGSITMLSGSPGDGKTFWLLQSLIGWKDAGLKVSVCMLEKQRDWHLNRVLALLAREPNLTKSEWISQHPNVMDEARRCFKSHIESIGESIFTARQVGETLDAIARWIDAEADESEIVVVDPISLADAGEQRWLADRNFIGRCIRTCERTGVRIILVTHPNTTKGGPATLASLMGGSTYQRATDCVMHVAKLEKPKPFQAIRDPAYPLGQRVIANRTVSVFKGRNGTAGGSSFAFNFDASTLRFIEQGVIVKEQPHTDETEEAA